jgi:hypothetical protein
LSLLGVFEFVERFVEVVGFWGLTECFEGIMVVLCPVSLLKFLELLLDIIGLILNDLDTFVVDMDAIVSLLDVCLKGFEEFVNLILEFLTLFRLSEIFVKSSECLSFISFSQLFKRDFNLLDWLSVLNFLHGILDIFKLILNSLSSCSNDLNLKHFHLIFPIFWDIRQLKNSIKRNVKVTDVPEDWE